MPDGSREMGPDATAAFIRLAALGAKPDTLCLHCFALYMQLTKMLYRVSTHKPALFESLNLPEGSRDSGPDATAAFSRLAALGSKPNTLGTCTASCQLATLKSELAWATGLRSAW